MDFRLASEFEYERYFEGGWTMIQTTPELVYLLVRWDLS
jgi:hypothetical protein